MIIINKRDLKKLLDFLFLMLYNVNILEVTKPTKIVVYRGYEAYQNRCL